MLTRIQIRAEGDTAHSITDELYDAADTVAAALGLDAKLTDQVVEGTPGEGFRGRLSFRLVEIKEPVA